jgi:hypothetical protein
MLRAAAGRCDCCLVMSVTPTSVPHEEKGYITWSFAVCTSVLVVSQEAWFVARLSMSQRRVHFAYSRDKTLTPAGRRNPRQSQPDCEGTVHRHQCQSNSNPDLELFESVQSQADDECRDWLA